MPSPQSGPSPWKIQLSRGSSNKQSTRDVPNIVVMVGGTVDPGNLDPTSRSASYHNPKLPKDAPDPNWYWGTNRPLVSALEELRQAYTNIHIFNLHGWTGDNAVANRRIAGAYLADRLCGGNREKPFYKAFLHQEVSIHLIGHSHGGNVINEFTRRAATSREWPKQWKIRSITYLSTPFFKRLHQVHTGAFHKDCRILNVFCKYDLTQRVIADFSLSPLHEVLKQAGASELAELLAGLKLEPAHVEEALKSVRPRDTDDRWWKVQFDLMMDPAKAARLYDSVLDVLAQLHKVFAKAKEVIARLNQGIHFPVAVELQGKVSTERKVLSDALAARFRAELNRIEAGLGPTEKAFQARRKSGKYPLAGFFDDLHLTAFLVPLIEFISVDRTSMSGPLWNLVAQLLVEQIDEFDNTSSSPEAQLRGTPFASRIIPLDVTSNDLYSTKKKDAEFGRFIARLEGIEARYAKTRSQRDLLELLFTLLAHVEPLRATVAKWATAVDWGEGATRFLAIMNMVHSTPGHATLSPKLLLLARLARVLENYFVIFRERDCGQLQVDAPKQTPPLGSLDYLAMVSHSISRQDLYPDVRRALKEQFDSRLRQGG